MGTFAEITLNPGGIVSWLVVGLLAGFLASCLMRGGYGFIGDTVVGLIGAVISGFLFGLFASGTTGFWGSIILAFFGACILIAIARTVRRASAGP